MNPPLYIFLVYYIQLSPIPKGSEFPVLFAGIYIKVKCLLSPKVGNPLYILLVLVGSGDTLIVSGIAGFAPKIIEEKFAVESSQSGLIMGKPLDLLRKVRLLLIQISNI